MTPAELDAALKALDIPAKAGAYVPPDGVSLTLHVASGGSSLAIGRVEHLRLVGELLVARSPKTTTAVLLSGVVALGREGSGTEGRRPAGFGA